MDRALFYGVEDTNVTNSLPAVKRLLAVVASLACASLATGAYAQTWPTKPIRLIVPNAPGGGTDTIARMVAEKVSPALGQQIVPDNRGGAGGGIAAEMVARAPKDGYTLLLTNPGPGIHNVLLRRRPPYTLADFAPIVHIGSASSIVVANMRVPAANIKELVAYAKGNPGKLNWASGGNNSNTHILRPPLALTSCTCLIKAPARR